MKELKGLQDVPDVQIDKDRKFHSASHDEILTGRTSDIYFLRTLDILKELNLDEAIVTAEIFPRKSGIFLRYRRSQRTFKGQEH